MGKYMLRNRQTMKTMNKTVFIVAGASMLGLAAYFTVFINTTQVSTSNAGLHKNMMLGYEISTGQVIASYTFEEGDITAADIGPDAISISESARVIKGGSSDSKGLTPGKLNKPLNMVIPTVKDLNLGGIDLSLDYRKSENDCDLFTRGSRFVIGIREGKIAVDYKLKQKTKTVSVKEITRYEIPEDDEFRNYRFVHNPLSGTSELFVNGVVIWSFEGEPESTIAWKEKDNMVVGNNLEGDGTEKVFIDNIVIKATQQSNYLPVTLLNFEARAENNYVMITWYTASESEIDSFIIERSYNAKDFVEIARTKATGGPDKLTAYAVVDKTPNEQLAYYRLVPSNKPLKSMTISMIGYKYRGEKGDIKVEDVNIPETEQ